MFAAVVACPETNPISGGRTAWRERDRTSLADGYSFRQGSACHGSTVSLEQVVRRACAVSELEAAILGGGAHLDILKLGLDTPGGAVQLVG